MRRFTSSAVEASFATMTLDATRTASKGMFGMSLFFCHVPALVDVSELELMFERIRVSDTTHNLHEQHVPERYGKAL